MATLEMVKPYRKLTQSKFKRWRINLSLTFINTLLIQILFPLTAVAFAQYCTDHQLGMMNLYEFFINLPTFVILILSFLMFDFFIYVQHRVVHHVPIFWRLHRVHHVDLDFDVTTGARFHPLEILLSMSFKFLLIYLIGPSPEGIILFEVLLNGTAMFNHSNIQLPKTVDKYLRPLLVTPNMHRIHHSVVERETNSNYGFCLSWWDFLYGTQIWESERPDPEFTIGIEEIRAPKKCTSFFGVLKLPFE